MKLCDAITFKPDRWDTYNVVMTTSGILLALFPVFEPTFQKIHRSVTWITWLVAAAAVYEGLRPRPPLVDFSRPAFRQPPAPPISPYRPAKFGVLRSDFGVLRSDADRFNTLHKPRWNPPKIVPEVAGLNFLACLRAGSTDRASLEARMNQCQEWEALVLDKAARSYDVTNPADRGMRELSLRLNVAGACGIHNEHFYAFVKYYGLSHDVLLAYACSGEPENDEEGEADGLLPIIEALQPHAERFQQLNGLAVLRSNLSQQYQPLAPALDRIKAAQKPRELSFVWGPVTPQRYLGLGIWLGLADQLRSEVPSLQSQWRLQTSVVSAMQFFVSRTGSYEGGLRAVGHILLALDPPNDLNPEIYNQLQVRCNEENLASLANAGALLAELPVNQQAVCAALEKRNDGDGAQRSGRTAARPTTQ